MTKQLYVLYQDAKLPDFAEPNPRARGVRVVRRSFQQIALLRWPDGRLCHIANYWLHDKLRSSTGSETANTYASLITPVIRYCYAKNIALHQMSDVLFLDLTKQLVNETRLTRRGIELARINNQTLQIQSLTLDLLNWIHKSFKNSIGQGLIGEGSEFRIIVEKRTNPQTGKHYFWHRHLVNSVPYKNDKSPIPEDFIDKIRSEIFRRHDVTNLPERSKHKLKSCPELFNCRNTYLYERRMFTVRMMKLMGLRPEELIDIPLNLNTDVLSRKSIATPTKKRGRPEPIRYFPITLRAAIDFNRYLRARQEFVGTLTALKIVSRDTKSLILNENGEPLKKASLTKEFDRICQGSDLGDARSCLSMFRHRFITREIHYILEKAFANDPTLKMVKTNALRDSVCAQVLPKTGHASEKSLWAYFHYEYDLMSQTSGYVKNIENRDRVEAAAELLLNLKFDNKLTPTPGIAEKIDQLERYIDLLRDEITCGPLAG